MAKNNFGFTMIELLAAVVVLGLLMGSAVPIVFEVLNSQRSNTYIDDAIRLAANADYKIRSDNDIQIPARGGGCVVINLAYMDNNAFEKGPYGGEYDRNASFVVASRNASSAEDEYEYYVMLVEKMKTSGYRGVNLQNVKLLYNDDARDKYVENIGSSAIIYVGNYKSDFSGLITNLRNINSTICPKGIWGIYVGHEF